jgi:hypothetical protein
MLSASSTYISFAYFLVSFISGFWRVSLAKYILVLRVYSHLLQVNYDVSWIVQELDGSYRNGGM